MRSEDLILALDLAGFAVSSGSACSSGIARTSRVLEAMGYDEEAASNTVRVSFTTQGEPNDVQRLAQVIRDVVQHS